MSEYLLGTSDHELARLTFQQEVWSGPTDAFLDAIGLRPGDEVLDLGAGPGLVTAVLQTRVGARGRVVAVDESERWSDHLQARVRAEGWTNVRVVRARLQELVLEPGQADAAFLRWVLSFLPEPDRILRRIARFVRPGGVVAVMDYNHEGISLFPRSPGFEAVIVATRASYAKRGGDTFVMGAIQRLFRAANLVPIHLESHVLSGGPDSPAFRWADVFFVHHAGRLVTDGTLSASDHARFLAEWNERRQDPDALFFSPIVAGAIGRVPA